MKYYRVILIMILSISLLMLGIESIGVLTGKATTTTPSEVIVNKFISMGFSSDLTDGIIFEEINFLPANNINASSNYNSMNQTEYFVVVSVDTNSEMDLCIKADSDLTNPGLDIIGIGNESYSSSINSTIDLPSIVNETSLSFVYTTVGESIPTGGRSNLRFWLDVPAGQAPGTYNNSIFFKGITSGDGC